MSHRSHRRVNKRTGVLAGAGATAIVAAAILLPNANASADKEAGPKAFTSFQAARLGSAVAADLGDDAAGWYYDGESDRLVVNVLDEAAADRVEAEGAVARVVENSIAELRAVTDELGDTASVPGTAWSIDPRTNKVTVLADSTVEGGDWATLERATGAMGDKVTVKRTGGEFRPFDHPAPRGDQPEGTGEGGQAAEGADGGDAIFGGGVRCSLGFNVTVDGAPAFLTAGHCGDAADTWTADQAGAQSLGATTVSEFPGSDYALVTYDDPAAAPPSTVDLKDGTTQEITRAAEATVGLAVRRSGSTTGLSDGTVTGLDATVNYGNGDIVNGLIQTDVCAEPGDSGGAMFADDAAIGLTSGGSGDCTTGGVTFFEPVTRALAETGAVIGTDDGGTGDGGAEADAGADNAGAGDGGVEDGGAEAGGADGGAVDGGAEGGAAVGGTGGQEGTATNGSAVNAGTGTP
ncbi:S1 family peptidase [Streptomyces capparidis]